MNVKKELKQLTTLNLSGTRVSDKGLRHLQEFKQLASLDLEREAAHRRDAAVPHLHRVQLQQGPVAHPGPSATALSPR